MLKSFFFFFWLHYNTSVLYSALFFSILLLWWRSWLAKHWLFPFPFHNHLHKHVLFEKRWCLFKIKNCMYVCDAQSTVLHRRLTATDSNERTRRERLPLVAMSSRTRVFFFPPRTFDFELCSNGWWKKALCTQDIWSGKKMERDGKRQGCKHGPQKLTCQKEKKARSASRTPNFVFNKFALTWETRVLSGDDFCDLFSVHGFVSQTLTAGAPVSAQRNQMTNQGRPLCSVFYVVCRQSSANERPLCDLDSDWKMSPLSRTSGIRERL